MTRMILEVLPYTGEILHNRNSEALQLGLIAYAGLHQYFGSIDRTERKHHLKTRADANGFAVVRNLHASGSPALEGQPSDQCPSEDSEIGPVHKREDIRTEYGLAFSGANYHINNSGTAVTLHHATVIT